MKNERFCRTELLLGQEALRRLNNAVVAVVGLGAVGSYAVEALARSGVGHLRLVDFDVVQLSNFNRQLYALESTLGKHKTAVAKARILEINPDCKVEAVDCFFDGSQTDKILNPLPDVLIDAIDSVGPKIELLSTAYMAKVPAIISSMGAATRTDPFCIRVGDISETRECPLAKFVRKRLKKRGISEGIKCVFSVERADKKFVLPADNSKFAGEKEYVERGRKRRVLGSFSCITGIFGLIAAREAIMLIIRRGISTNTGRVGEGNGDSC